MNQKEILKTAQTLIKNQFSGETTGHDFYHIERVVKMARKIAAEENSRKATQEAAAQRAQQDELEKRAQQEAAKRQASYERENLIRQIEAKFPELDPRSSQHNSNAVSLSASSCIIKGFSVLLTPCPILTA